MLFTAAVCCCLLLFAAGARVPGMGQPLCFEQRDRRDSLLPQLRRTMPRIHLLDPRTISSCVPNENSFLPAPCTCRAPQYGSTPVREAEPCIQGAATWFGMSCSQSLSILQCIDRFRAHARVCTGQYSFPCSRLHCNMRFNMRPAPGVWQRHAACGACLRYRQCATFRR